MQMRICAWGYSRRISRFSKVNHNWQDRGARCQSAAGWIRQAHRRLSTEPREWEIIKHRKSLKSPWSELGISRMHYRTRLICAFSSAKGTRKMKVALSSRSPYACTGSFHSWDGLINDHFLQTAWGALSCSSSVPCCLPCISVDEG